MVDPDILYCTNNGWIEPHNESSCKRVIYI